MYEAIIGFGIGFIAGFIASYIVHKKKLIKFNIKNLMAGAVLVGWLASVIAEIMLAGTYSTPWEVHGIMGGVAAYYFKFDIPLVGKK